MSNICDYSFDIFKNRHVPATRGAFALGLPTWRKPPLGLDGLNYLNSDCIRREVKERISELGAVRE